MAIFDQQAFYNLIDGDKALFAELYRLYNEEWTSIMYELRRQLEAGKAYEVAGLAHRLKGMTRNFFAAETAALCGEVEDLAIAEKLKDIGPKLEPLLSSLKSLDEALNSHLKSF